MPWLQGTGAVGVQSTLNEAYTSMQTGVYDGWVMLADPILSFKLNEVSKQFVDMDFGAIATPLITMNKDAFNGLPPEVRKIILEEGKHYNETMGRVTYERQVASVARMKELGLEVRQADAGTKEAWAKQLANIPKQRFEEINKARHAGRGGLRLCEGAQGGGTQIPA